MISEEFVGRFLWTPGVQDGVASPIGDCTSENSDVSLPEFRFSSGVLSELDALVALAFSNIDKDRASTVDSFNSSLSEKSLVISCSQWQGTHAIDAAVKHAARKQDADVLVLDALDIACGRFGTLGTHGNVIDNLHPATKYDENDTENGVPDLNEEAVRYIDALLAIRSTSSDGSVGDDSAPDRRRIVYLRDFQYIRETAKPLLTYILHSLHLSFDWNYPPDPYSLNPRASQTFTPLVVFGINGKDEDLVVGFDPKASQMNCLFLSSLFIYTRSTIAKQNVTECYCTACKPFNNGASAGVEVALVPCVKKLGEKVDELASGALRMPIFAANVKVDAAEDRWQKSVKEKLFRTLNHVVLRACLERGHCPLYEAPGDIVPLDILPSTSILEVQDATRVVSLTMGLIAAAVRSKEPLQHISAYVKDAYEMYDRRKQERADWEKGIDPTQPPPSEDDGEPDSGSDSDGPATPKDSEPVLQGLSEHAESLKGCIVDISSIPTTFGDVFVDPATIESLQTIVSLPLLFPSYFNSGVLAKEAIGGILLYGPPGTGKTMLCRALAKSSHARMLHIQPSDINDKWVGESEKKVAGVFELAYKLSPCIVFIDEIDALFSSRNDGTKSWERNILTEFMQGMDGLRSAKKNRDSNIVVVGATNRPFDLDLAILRRMPRRILVDLPTFQMRKGILGSYLQNEVLDDDVSIEKLAHDTEGFSGSDLKNLCVAAALASVKQTIGPQWKDRVSSPSKPGTTKDDNKGKPEEDLPVRKITAANIRQAQHEISKSIAGNRGDKLYKWHKSHVTTEEAGSATGVPDSADASTLTSTANATTHVPLSAAGVAAMQSMLRMCVSGAGNVTHGFTSSSIISLD